MKRAPLMPYEEYKEIQIHRSGKKWGCHPFWDNILYFKDAVQEALRITKEYPRSVCCMGIRNGNEYLGFKEIIGFQNVEIYGVDIHPDVVKVGKNCFCEDFNHLPILWEKKFDWVYSNSVDHSYNFEETMKEWHRVCKGYILLTMSQDTDVGGSDVYSFSIEEAKDLFDKKLFEVLGVWQGRGAEAVFNVFLKIK